MSGARAREGAARDGKIGAAIGWAAVSVALRPADDRDCRIAWTWRNDPVTRAASFDSEPIPYQIHEHWFRSSLARADRRIYVVTAGAEPAGVVRLDIGTDEAVVSINLAPERRGRGIGPVALDLLADVAFGELGLSRLTAVVKRDNRASLAAFAKAGFTPVDQGDALTLERRRIA